MKPRFLSILACAPIAIGGCALLADYDFGAYEERTGAGGDGGTTATGLGGSGGDGAAPTTTTTTTTTTATATSGTGGSGGEGGYTVEVLYSGPDQPKSLDVDATHVYWTTSPPLAEPTGTVMRLQKDGGSLPEALALGVVSPYGMQVDASAAYWSTSGATSGDIHKWPKPGGPTVLVHDTQGPLHDFALGNQRLYWSGGNAIWSMEPRGGDVQELLSTTATGVATMLAVNGSGIYWVTPGGLNDYDSLIYRAALDGSGVTVLATNQDLPSAITSDQERVYWCTFHGGVLSTPIEGGEILAHVEPNANSNVIFDLAVGAARIYYTHNYDVRSVPVDGTTSSIVATLRQQPDRVALDATSIYVVTRGSMVGEVIRISN